MIFGRPLKTFKNPKDPPKFSPAMVCQGSEPYVHPPALDAVAFLLQLDSNLCVMLFLYCSFV